MFDNSVSLIRKRDHLNTLIEKKLRSDNTTKKSNGSRKVALLGWLGITMLVDKKTRQGVLDSISEFMPNDTDKNLFKNLKIVENISEKKSEAKAQWNKV